MFHANDMLDQKFIQNGQFTPVYDQGSVSEAILEIVKMIKSTLAGKNKNLCIKVDVTSLKHLYPVLSFDKRRLQQVVLNLLSNAIKF